jgi:hypothetical protein
VFPLKAQMEGYCGYARQALMYLQWEWGIRKGTRQHNAIPKPTKQKSPPARIQGGGNLPASFAPGSWN